MARDPSKFSFLNPISLLFHAIMDQCKVPPKLTCCCVTMIGDKKTHLGNAKAQNIANHTVSPIHRPYARQHVHEKLFFEVYNTIKNNVNL